MVWSQKQNGKRVVLENIEVNVVVGSQKSICKVCIKEALKAREPIRVRYRLISHPKKSGFGDMVSRAETMHIIGT